MDQLSFILTIFFMLLGPIKLIPSFAGVTQGMDTRFKRSVAIRAAVIAFTLCVFVALAGESLLDKYRISLDAVRIAGGLVLLIAALQVIFQKAQPSGPSTGKPTAMQLAASPVVVPNIVSPAGIAAILICTLLAPQYSGMMPAVLISLAIIIGLDLLVMFFIDRVVKIPGLAIILTVLGSVLVFVQVALAINMMLVALKSLGIAQG